MKEVNKTLDRIVTAIGLVLCVVFGLMLALNITIIVKGLINPDWPPSVFGRTPMIVKSGSMSSDVVHLVEADAILELTDEQKQTLKPGDTVKTKSADYIEINVVETAGKNAQGEFVITTTRSAPDHIEVDDLIFAKTVDTQALEVGQIITFMETDPSGNRTGSVVTHRIVEVLDTNGARAYRTKGDANNTIDTVPTKPENIIGLYVSRVPKIGAFIYFLQKPWGMAIFIGVPVLAFIIYDIIRRQRSAKREDNKVEALEEELKRLRELAGKQNGGGDPPDAGN